MALTAASMKEKVKAHVAGVAAAQGSDPAAMLAYRDSIIEAMCAGIIEEITTNAEVQTLSGAPDGEHTGIVK